MVKTIKAARQEDSNQADTPLQCQLSEKRIKRSAARFSKGQNARPVHNQISNAPPKDVSRFQRYGSGDVPKRWRKTPRSLYYPSRIFLIESAKRHGLNVFDYLSDVMRRLPGLPRRNLAELLPDQWKAPQPAEVAAL